MTLENEQNLLLKDLVKLMTKIVEQNNILIQNKGSKEDYIVELLEALVEGQAEDDDSEDYTDDIYRTLD